MEPSVKFAHMPVLLNSLPGIYQSECHVDVTFVCDNGVKVKAHKLLLGSVSPLLQHIFRSQSPRDMIEILLPEISADDLDNLLRYTYEGLIRLDKYEVKEFKKLKKMLQINIPTIISEIPDDNEVDKEDEELLELYYPETSINSTPCSCQDFKQVSSEEKSDPAHGKKRLNPFNSSYTSNTKKMRLETQEQSNVPQDLNNLLRGFSSNQGIAECGASMTDKENCNQKEVSDSHSVQKCPRPIPLELYRDLVHKVLRKKTMEEAKLFVNEEVERKLEEELEKKLAERLAKEGKLILLKDFRAKDASILQKSPVNHSREKDKKNPGCIEHSACTVETEGNGKEKGKNNVIPPLTPQTVPRAPHLRELLNAPQSSDMPMPKPVGIKVIGPCGSTSRSGKIITSDGKVLILKITKEQQYSVTPSSQGMLHDKVTKAVIVPLSTSQGIQLSRTTNTQKIMTTDEKEEVTRKEQENK